MICTLSSSLDHDFPDLWNGFLSYFQAGRGVVCLLTCGMIYSVLTSCVENRPLYGNPRVHQRFVGPRHRRCGKSLQAHALETCAPISVHNTIFLGFLGSAAINSPPTTVLEKRCNLNPTLHTLTWARRLKRRCGVKHVTDRSKDIWVAPPSVTVQHGSRSIPPVGTRTYAASACRHTQESFLRCGLLIGPFSEL